MRAFFVRVLEQDGELVAADPRDDVALAHAADEQSRDLDQRLVAGAVAELSLISFSPSRSTNSMRRLLS